MDIDTDKHMRDQNFPILIVEDDEVDIMNVKRAFKKNNLIYPLHFAHNGVEALELLKGNLPVVQRLNPLPKIILLDLNMPKMGGIEFLEELRNDPELKRISVFVMTTSDEESDKIAAYNYNVAGYILKPLSFDKFVKAMAILDNYWKLCRQV